MKLSSFFYLIFISIVSVSVNAGLTSMCDPRQDLGTHVSYLDKITNENSLGGATANSFYQNIKTTLRGTSSSYLDYLNPSQLKFNWGCEGPCSFESEATFIRLQYGVKMRANDAFKNASKYLQDISTGRYTEEIYVGLRDDIKFDGYYNNKKIPASIKASVDDLLAEAKTTGKPFTRDKLISLPGFKDFFNNDYDDVNPLINASRLNQRKTLLVNLSGFDKNDEVLMGHAVNVVLEGVTPTSKFIIISNGEISAAIEFSNLTSDSLKTALIKTLSNSKVVKINYNMLWA